MSQHLSQCNCTRRLEDQGVTHHAPRVLHDERQYRGFESLRVLQEIPALVAQLEKSIELLPRSVRVQILPGAPEIL